MSELEELRALIKAHIEHASEHTLWIIKAILDAEDAWLQRTSVENKDEVTH